MEDSVGVEMLLRQCLNEREFRAFMNSLDKILSDKEAFKDICRKWTKFYMGKNEESEEAYNFLMENSPQPFTTWKADFGPCLNVTGIGITKRIKGIEQIREYVEKMQYYAEQHGILTRIS